MKHRCFTGFILR